MILNSISPGKIRFMVADRKRALEITESICEKMTTFSSEQYNPKTTSSGNNFVIDSTITLSIACDGAINSIRQYPTDLEDFLDRITTAFQDEIDNLVQNKLLPYSRLMMLTSYGLKTLRKVIEHRFWYPLGVSKLNPGLWCKHWTLKRECRTCKFMTLFLLRTDPNIIFPPKDILKLIFNMLPQNHVEDLRNPPPLHSGFKL